MEETTRIKPCSAFSSAIFPEILRPCPETEPTKSLRGAGKNQIHYTQRQPREDINRNSEEDGGRKAEQNRRQQG